MEFPIYRLNEAVTEAMSKMVSLGIAGEISKGLDPQIQFVDESGGPLSTIAEIIEVKGLHDSPRHHVKISAAYAQILWMICSIALRNHDSFAIRNELHSMSPEEQAQFMNEVQVGNTVTNYLRDLVDTKTTLELSTNMLNIIEVICKRSLTQNKMEELHGYDMISDIGVRINGLYVYAMTFILLHEFSHHSLGHDLQAEGSIDEEVAADYNAFGAIYNDLNDAEKQTAMLGILCSLVSLIFINTNLSNDNIHPKPIDRIFEFFDLIKQDYPKLAGLLCHLFYSWAVYVHDDNFPKQQNSYDETLAKIKDYLMTLQNNAEHKTDD